VYPGLRKLRPVILRFAVALGINAAALWLADAIFSSVRIDGWKSYVIGAAVLGIANGLLKPVLAILTLPLIIITLGLFLLVINIAMVALAEWAAPNFSIDGFCLRRHRGDHLARQLDRVFRDRRAREPAHPLRLAGG
jgi:putative membrane protein